MLPTRDTSISATKSTDLLYLQFMVKMGSNRERPMDIMKQDEVPFQVGTSSQNVRVKPQHRDEVAHPYFC